MEDRKSQFCHAAEKNVVAQEISSYAPTPLPNSAWSALETKRKPEENDDWGTSGGEDKDEELIPPLVVDMESAPSGETKVLILIESVNLKPFYS